MRIGPICIFAGWLASGAALPVAAVGSAELSCHVKDEDGKTHAEKGVVGSIEIK